MATPAPTPEQPREVVIGAALPDGSPLAGVAITAGSQRAMTDAAGQATLMLLVGTTVEATLDGHDPADGVVGADGPLQLELRNNVARGTIADEAGKPIAGVRVFVDGQAAIATSDNDGAYALPNVPEGATLVYKMPGYRIGEVKAGADLAIDVTMQPFQARALYAPAAVFEAPGRLDAMLELIDRTEVNAMVIDVKETDGRLYWATDLPEAVAVGAVRENPVFDVDELLPKLKAHGIYTIARMVSMKDNTLAAARPELAVMNVATGEPWRDNIGGAWLDPSAPGVGSTWRRWPATWRPRASTRSSSTTSAFTATAPTTWPIRTCPTRSHSGCRPSGACCGS